MIWKVQHCNICDFFVNMLMHDHPQPPPEVQRGCLGSINMVKFLFLQYGFVLEDLSLVSCQGNYPVVLYLTFSAGRNMFHCFCFELFISLMLLLSSHWPMCCSRYRWCQGIHFPGTSFRRVWEHVQCSCMIYVHDSVSNVFPLLTRIFRWSTLHVKFVYFQTSFIVSLWRNVLRVSW